MKMNRLTVLRTSSNTRTTSRYPKAMSNNESRNPVHDIILPIALIEDFNSLPPPESGGPDKHHIANAGSRLKLALMGSVWSVASTFPIAGLMALVFRFPIPFAGYRSGFAAIQPAILAVLFYGVFVGGFVLVGLLGAVGGFVAATFKGPDLQSQKRAVRLVSLAITTACLFILACLDM